MLVALVHIHVKEEHLEAFIEATKETHPIASKKRGSRASTSSSSVAIRRALHSLKPIMMTMHQRSTKKQRITTNGAKLSLI